MTPRCRECFKPLPEGSYTQRRYCNNSCKQAAWRGGRTIYQLVESKLNRRSKPELPLETREGACPRCDLLMPDGTCHYCLAEMLGLKLESNRAAA
jgi:hypothetical protein